MKRLCSTWFLFAAISSITAVIGYAQTKPDSLQRALRAAQSAEAKVNIFNELAFQYYGVDDSIAFKYAQTALELATDTKYRKGLKVAHTLVGQGPAVGWRVETRRIAESR